MSYSEKGTVEDFIIQELQKLGWKFLNQKEMEAKRKGRLDEPLVLEDLRISIRKLNPDIDFTDADLDFVAVSLRTMPSNLEGIRRFLDIFRNGIVVPIQKENKEKVVGLFDLASTDNNEFVVTNQFKLEGSKANIRADIILLVNGIPLVCIECKSPTQENVDWTTGYTKIKRYERDAPELFKYVQYSIATDGMKTKYFPNGFNDESTDFISEWKDPHPFKASEFKDDILKATVYGLLSRSNLLDLIENFTFIRKETDKSTKIMTRYMQFRATEKICKRVIQTLKGKENSKFGLIWHWQGSGKTYTMAFTAWKLYFSSATERPSIFVLVDRKDLEEQIEKDFGFIEVPLERIHSIRELVEVLRHGKEGKRGVFLVTIEKFSPKEFKELAKESGEIEIKRENVIVLADEVHRTQYGKFSTLMRHIFKKAFIFGFTGTPLSKLERNTFSKFCPRGELYLDRYSMLDALKDGFSVELSYQPKLPEYHLNEKQYKQFVKFEEEEIKTLSKVEQKELRKKIRVITAFVKKPERVSAITADIAQHFKDVVEPTDLKAMVVTIDRDACVQYKTALDKALPPDFSEIVMTFTPDDEQDIRSYFDKLCEKYGTKDMKDIHDKIIDSFKTGKQPKILIVTDMLITGFDAPVLWTMYLDKPLKEHRVLQAIARTNRPFLNKKFGLIEDYIGVLAELQKAFQKFEASDAKDLRVVIRQLDKEKEEFKGLLQKALRIFESVKKEDTRESLESAMDVLVNPETAKQFEAVMRSLMKSYEMLRGEAFLAPYLSDYTWLTKMLVAYNKRFKKKDVDELKIQELSRKTYQLIQQTIDVKEIEDTYPTLSINAEYVEALKKSKPKTMGAAIDVIADIRHEASIHPSSPFFLNLSREIETAYEDLRTKKVDIEEAVHKAIDFSEKIAAWKTEENEIGKDKYPLYEAVKTVLPDVEKQKAVSFVNRLTEHLQELGLLFEGWQLQRDVRRKVKSETRFLLLSDYKEHHDKIDELTEQLFGAMEGMQ